MREHFRRASDESRVKGQASAEEVESIQANRVEWTVACSYHFKNDASSGGGKLNGSCNCSDDGKSIGGCKGVIEC